MKSSGNAFLTGDRLVFLFSFFSFFPKQSLKSVSEIFTLSTADRRVEICVEKFFFELVPFSHNSSWDA